MGYCVVHAVSLVATELLLLRAGAILRVFGSKVGRGAKIYSSVKVFLPSNLTVGNHAIIGWGVDCYNVAPVTVGSHAIVSQYS